MPDPVLSAPCWHHIRRLTRSRGQVVFNTIAQTANGALVKAQLGELGFAVQEYPRVEQSNTILIAHLP
ncbi:MAG: hypothetical protein NVSMB30_29630 [Hymenobacter sp.]